MKKWVLALIVAIGCLSIAIFLIYRANQEAVKKQTIDNRIQAYYDKAEYYLAEKLAENYLNQYPLDERGIDWLKKIEEAQKESELTASPVDLKTDISNEELRRELVVQYKRLLSSLNTLQKEIKKEKQTETVRFVNKENKPIPYSKTTADVNIVFDADVSEEISRLLKEGSDAYQKKDYLTAKSKLTQLLYLDKTQPLANAYLGAIMFELNPGSEENIENAVTYCHTALKGDSKLELAYFTLAQIYLEKKLYSEAENFLKETIKLKPDNWEANYLLGKLYYSRNESQLAKEYFTVALNAKTDFVNGYYYLAMTEKIRGEYEQMKKHLEKVIVLDPFFLQAYNDLAEIYVSEHDYNKALLYFKKSVAVQKNYQTLFEIGYCYRQLGETEQAASYFESSLKENPALSKNQKDLEFKALSALLSLYEAAGKHIEAERLQNTLNQKYSVNTADALQEAGSR